MQKFKSLDVGLINVCCSQMHLEIVMLSEVKSDREGEIPHDSPYMQTLKRNGTNEFIYKTETDSQTQKMNLWLHGQQGYLGSLGSNLHTAVF